MWINSWEATECLDALVRGPAPRWERDGGAGGEIDDVATGRFALAHHGDRAPGTLKRSTRQLDLARGCGKVEDGEDGVVAGGAGESKDFLAIGRLHFDHAATPGAVVQRAGGGLDGDKLAVELAHGVLAPLDRVAVEEVEAALVATS